MCPVVLLTQVLGLARVNFLHPTVVVIPVGWYSFTFDIVCDEQNHHLLNFRHHFVFVLNQIDFALLHIVYHI